MNLNLNNGVIKIKKRHNEEYELLEQIENRLNEQLKITKELVRDLRIVKKRIQVKGKPDKRKMKGFTKLEDIPEDVCNLLGISYPSEITRNELANKLRDLLKKRKLIYQEDKRIYRVDEEISKIFNIDMSVNEIIDSKDKSGFNMYNIHRYLANKIKNNK